MRPAITCVTPAFKIDKPPLSGIVGAVEYKKNMFRVVIIFL